MNLTDMFLQRKSLKQGVYSDDVPGLAIYIGVHRKTWMLRIRNGSKHLSVRLGHYRPGACDHVGIAAARQAARDHADRIRGNGNKDIRAQEEARAAELESLLDCELAAFNGSSGWVYCIRAVSTSCVKIGFTTDLRVRLATLRTACPDQLRLLATLPGDRSLEATLHGLFARRRRKDGEWFSDSDQMIAEFFAIKQHETQLQLASRLRLRAPGN